MKKKDKLVALNATIPSSLKKYAEEISASDYDSMSDYIRSLIKEHKQKKDTNPWENLIEALAQVVRDVGAKDHNVIDSEDGLETLHDKLLTINALFETGLSIRKGKLERENSKISQTDLLKKLNSWALSPAIEEIPGLFEISEQRKRQLIDE